MQVITWIYSVQGTKMTCPIYYAYYYYYYYAYWAQYIMHREQKYRVNGRTTSETENVIVSYHDEDAYEYDDNYDDDDDEFVAITTNQLMNSTLITLSRGMKYLR